MSHFDYTISDVTIENLPYGTWEDDVVKLLNESLPGCAKKFVESNIKFKTNFTTATVKITPGHNPLQVLSLNGCMYEGHILNVYTDLQPNQELRMKESGDFKCRLEYPTKSPNTISKLSKSNKEQPRTFEILPPPNFLPQKPQKPQKQSTKRKLDLRFDQVEIVDSKCPILLPTQSANEISRGSQTKVQQRRTLEIIPPANILLPQKPQKRSSMPQLEQELRKIASSDPKCLIEFSTKSTNKISRCSKPKVEQQRTLDIVLPTEILPQKPVGSTMPKLDQELQNIESSYDSKFIIELSTKLTNKINRSSKSEVEQWVEQLPTNDILHQGPEESDMPKLPSTDTRNDTVSAKVLTPIQCQMIQREMGRNIAKEPTTDIIAGILAATEPQEQEGQLVSGMKARLGNILDNALLAKLNFLSS
ncbi:uncharacterized protein LOC117641020 [Thrips palmi]|uniref:Uncharacterized protein LOC117641020 n=1 Tax=Thrips palmi TaxID=161013 RepID=A0A6P8ZIQ3_THRPL|nr:uncharacterized protein LOC117641020 [Thrips palmi]